MNLRKDLSQRILELFKESSGAYLQLIFRQFGDWLKRKHLEVINTKGTIASATDYPITDLVSCEL